MTEEKRILYSRCGVGLCNRFDKWGLWAGIDKPSDCTPFAKDEIQNIMKDLGQGAVMAFMVVQDLTNTYYHISMNNIDDEWFWKVLCQPVPKQKWYVKVPHTTGNCCYCICNTADDRVLLRICDPKNPETYPTDIITTKFIDEEIKHYHLEDCERETVDE
jgi:hypothetical protein